MLADLAGQCWAGLGSLVADKAAKTETAKPASIGGILHWTDLSIHKTRNWMVCLPTLRSCA